MNIPTIIILAVILVLFGLCVWRFVKNRGGCDCSSACGGGCDHCAYKDAHSGHTSR